MSHNRGPWTPPMATRHGSMTPFPTTYSVAVVNRWLGLVAVCSAVWDTLVNRASVPNPNVDMM
jgi:hypothetical protein